MKKMLPNINIERKVIKEKTSLLGKVTLFPLIFTGLFVWMLGCYSYFRLGSSYKRYFKFILEKQGFFSIDESLSLFTNLWRNYWYHQKDGWIPIVIFLIFSLIVAWISLFTKKEYRSEPNTDEITRGNKLLTAEEVNKELTENLINDEMDEIYEDLAPEKKRSFDREAFRSNLLGKPFLCTSNQEKVFIPEFLFSYHTALFGATGAGKTTVIKHLLKYFNNNGSKSIIFDLNGEIYSEFGRDEDIIISPNDSRSVKWDFNNELSLGRKINPLEFAKFIVPKGADNNRFWWGGARTVLAEIIKNFSSSSQIWAAITDPKRGFIKSLDGIVYNIIGKIGSNQDAGILGTLSSDLAFLKDLIKLNEISSKEPFSIASWAQSKSCENVFIVFSDKDAEKFAPLIRIWLNLAILGRFDAGKDNDLPYMNLIADELGDLGNLDRLPSGLARLRKYGGRIVIGLQSEGQLEEIYGRSYTKSMKANIGTRFIFRTQDEEDAEKISSFLGRSEVISVSNNTNVGGTNDGQGTTSKSTSYKNIVLASEVMELKNGHYYLKSLNIHPAKLRILKQRWPQKHSLHQENNWEPDNSDTSITNEKATPSLPQGISFLN